MAVRIHAFGYPKIGPRRELKKSIETFWKDEISHSQLQEQADTVYFNRIRALTQAGIDSPPCFDFSLYDSILDHALMFGVIPKRFLDIENDTDLYFAMARGKANAVACEMTKWFDTNYHYIVPEFSGEFHVRKNFPLEQFQKIKTTLGIATTPVLIGPFTFLNLGKTFSKQGTLVSASESPHFKEWLLTVSSLYNQILKELDAAGVKTVQLDEPSWVMDRPESDIPLLIEAYRAVGKGLKTLKIHVQTYYESLSHYKEIVYNLPVQWIGVDLVSNSENLKNIQKWGFPKDKTLIAGVVSGRDPWKTNLKQTSDLVQTLLKTVSKESLILSNAAPLFHLPHTIQDEKQLDPRLLRMLAFADERLEELKTLKSIVNEGIFSQDMTLADLHRAFDNAEVKSSLAQLNEIQIGRPELFSKRYEVQKQSLGLTDFPTTTIGSFPQTAEVREKRASFRNGKLSPERYTAYIQQQIKQVIALQEEIGLDILVHGEFERTDMVEFFGEKLDGFAFTQNGWVQSYGTRCVKPPLIYGDVFRPEPMTVAEVRYAQSLTSKWVKGMLTGPVTILNWSFYRKDIPKKHIAYQIALALKKEVLDLEKEGIRIIQIDEPAFREGLPLKKSNHKEYLSWAVNAFKLTHDTVKPTTQIHTHMCYSEFNEIIQSISDMDADVISIEASRSQGEILNAFHTFQYRRGIGLGVYDIHSPRVPSVEEMLKIAKRSVEVIGKDLIWINPDCGLKTRGYEETVPALKNMVSVARALKKELVNTSV